MKMEDFFQDGFKPSTGLTIGAIACGAGKLQRINILLIVVEIFVLKFNLVK